MFDIARKTGEIWQTSKGADTREDGVGLDVALAILIGSIGCLSNLCASISGQGSHGLVPQALVGSCHWLLFMVIVGRRKDCKSSNGGKCEQHHERMYVRRETAIGDNQHSERSIRRNCSKFQRNSHLSRPSHRISLPMPLPGTHLCRIDHDQKCMPLPRNDHVQEILASKR